MDFLATKVERVVFAKLSKGEDLLRGVKEAATRAAVTSGVFFAIGTLTQAVFGFYSPEMKPVVLKEPLEIVSCIGNIAKKGEDLAVHGHICVTDSKYAAYGGHLLEGSIIDAVGEILILELAGGVLERDSEGKWKL